MSEKFLQGKAAQRYVDLEPLGQGGMGSVYRAWDKQMARSVVLKLPRADKATNKEYLKRLRNEAKALAKLDHANIVRLYDFDSNEGHPFIVTEDVDGTELSNYIGGDALSLRESIMLLVELSKGLEAAHEANILHRDIKPGNVLVTPNGTPKLIDFGLVLQKGDEKTTRMTATGVVVGTFLYSAPEVLTGATDANVGSDVYSFGVLAYELITGEHPYAGVPALKLCSMEAELELEKPSALCPQVDELLNELLLSAISRDPDQRPTSITEIRRRLSRWLKRSETMAGKQRKATVTASATAVTNKATESSAKSSVPSIFGAAFLLLIALLFCYALFPFGKSEAQKRALSARAEGELFKIRDELLKSSPIDKGEAFDKVANLLAKTTIPKRMGIGSIVEPEIVASYFLAHSSKKKVPHTRTTQWYEKLLIKSKLANDFVRTRVLAEYLDLAVVPDTAMRVPQFLTENVEHIKKRELIRVYEGFLLRAVPKIDYGMEKAPPKSRKDNPLRLALEKRRAEVFALGEKLLRANDNDDSFRRNFKLHLEFVSWLLRDDYRKQLHSLRNLLKEKKGNHWQSYAYLAVAFASVYMTKIPDVDMAKELMRKAEEKSPAEERPVLSAYQALFIAIHASRYKNKPEITKAFQKEALVHSQRVVDRCHLLKGDMNRVRLIHLMVLVNYYSTKKTTPTVISHLLSVFKEIDLDKIPDEYKYIYVLGSGVINEKKKKFKEASADYELAVYFAPPSCKGRAMATLYTQELIRGLGSG